jgi:hypothetical protein
MISASINNYYYRRIININLNSTPYVIPYFATVCRTNSTRPNLEPPLCRGSAMLARGASLALPFARPYITLTLSPGIASGWEQRFMPCSHSRRSSLLLATNRAPIICFPLTGNARCLVTCCPAAGLSIEKGQGRRTCCSFLCCLLVFHSWSRPPFFSLLLIYLSCVTFTPPRTIEQTLRLPSHDHRLNCPRPAMPQLPPSTRPQHQTPKPCLRNQNT